MKHGKHLKGLALLCALVCLALAAVPAFCEDDERPRKERDLSGLVEQDGRVTGEITGLDWNGKPGVAMLVDAALPADFTDAQRAVIRTERVSFADSAKLIAALEATGAVNIRIDPEGIGRADWGNAQSDPKRATMTADEARENAKHVAAAFCQSVGVGDIVITSALRPEDEAKNHTIDAAPEAREAMAARILREWFRADRDYTDVRFDPVLRGLRAVGGLMEETEYGEAWLGITGQLLVGDAGEVRSASIVLMPREVSAEPYAGELISWREALEEISQRFGVTAYGDVRRDDHGRETPMMHSVVTGIEPGYATRDGETYAPAWLFTIDWMRVEDGALWGDPHTDSVDARAQK